jgi:hypothetical protein
MPQVDFTHTLNQRVYHPTGISGRVIGLLAGLEGRRLANVQHLDRAGNLQNFWALENELKTEARRSAADVRNPPYPAKCPSHITHVRGEWWLIQVRLTVRGGGMQPEYPRPVAVFFADDEGNLHSRAITQELWLEFYGHPDLWHALQRIRRTGDPRSEHAFTGTPHRFITGPSAREIIADLYARHIAPLWEEHQ